MRSGRNKLKFSKTLKPNKVSNEAVKKEGEVVQNNFTQLCVWQGTVLGEKKKQEFIDWIKEEFDCRATYECEVKTLPSLDENRSPIKDTGGRNDLFFYIHTDDIPKFAGKRIAYSIRWWEDVVVYNVDGADLYTSEFKEKYKPTW